MQRRSVVLPEPHGPMIATRSPRATSRSNAAEHLERAEALPKSMILHQRRRSLLVPIGTKAGRAARPRPLVTAVRIS